MQICRANLDKFYNWPRKYVEHRRKNDLFKRYISLFLMGGKQWKLKTI